jgi:hypothetical protein
MKRLLRTILLVCALPLSASNCAPYTAIQMKLVEQARKGVASVQERQAAQGDAIESAYALRKRQLDDAFDADAMAQPAASGAWIVEARRAYAVGLDELFRQRQSQLDARRAVDQTLHDIDSALEQLARLQALEFEWASLKLKERP